MQHGNNSWSTNMLGDGDVIFRVWNSFTHEKQLWLKALRIRNCYTYCIWKLLHHIQILSTSLVLFEGKWVVTFGFSPQMTRNWDFLKFSLSLAWTSFSTNYITKDLTQMIMISQYIWSMSLLTTMLLYMSKLNLCQPFRSDFHMLMLTLL